jgi:hypothetical protein
LKLFVQLWFRDACYEHYGSCVKIWALIKNLPVTFYWWTLTISYFYGPTDSKVMALQLLVVKTTCWYYSKIWFSGLWYLYFLFIIILEITIIADLILFNPPLFHNCYLIKLHLLMLHAGNSSWWTQPHGYTPPLLNKLLRNFPINLMKLKLNFGKTWLRPNRRNWTLRSI